MADHTEDNDPFEEDIVFDETGLLGGKMPRSRQQSTVGFLPTFMLFIRTVFLCTAFVGLGLCMSVSGEPLIKMELVVGTSVDTAFHTFTARSFGMLLGGILGSLLFEVYNRQFLIFVSLIWVAVSVTVLPFTVPTALWWTFTTTASLGMGLGFLFTGGNVLCLDLWGRQGGASLQALHFSFAVGAFIVPLVIQPFFASLHTRLHSNLSDGQDLASTDKEIS
ncbi:sodium-dependent glucose transporter 1-like isoform X3 [Homarus americanus]|uniref:sodium-dependent glucose transporter 1-like isoform X3 n=1 Tax=Homarus americanus TaxID=6706 RepID=UPI001C442869|nr:sodium-dependent glucose transporter 1-like isoform X3 [Homarus americanus]